MRRSTFLTAVLFSLGVVHLAADPAAAAPGASSKSSSKKSKKKAREPVFSGFQVPLSKLRTNPLPRPSGHIELVNINWRGETLAVDLYNPDGSFNDDALDELNHFWRCKRTGTEKPINPHLFELLSHVYDRFQAPIELVSGFRNQEHKTSFHFHGSAGDIRVRGVDPSEVHAFAITLDYGGIGIGRYPRAHFVHIDVRPEPSYRWVDRSPPGGDGGSKKKSKKRRNA